MRVVFDTNVIVSAILSPQGDCRRLVDHAISGRLTLITCPELTGEYLEVLSRSSIARLTANSGERVETFVRLLVEAGDTGEIHLTPGVVARDRDDDIVIGCALGGRAAYIVTGDQDLLTLRSSQGVMILRPREMVLLLGAGG